MVRITIKVMIINSAAAPRCRRRVAPGAGYGGIDMVPRSASGDGPGRQQVFDHSVAVDGLAGFDEMSSLRSIHQPDVAIAIGPCRLIAGGILDGGPIDPHDSALSGGTERAVDDPSFARRGAGAAPCGRRRCECAAATRAFDR